MTDKRHQALVVEVGRALLSHIEQARNEEAFYITYGALANMLPFEFNPRNLDKPLGDLSDICIKHKLPLISTIVVNQDDLLPGIGYFKYFFPDAKSEKERLGIFSREYQAVLDWQDWNPLIDALGI